MEQRTVKTSPPLLGDLHSGDKEGKHGEIENRMAGNTCNEEKQASMTGTVTVTEEVRVVSTEEVTIEQGP